MAITVPARNFTAVQELLEEEPRNRKTVYTKEVWALFHWEIVVFVVHGYAIGQVLRV